MAKIGASLFPRFWSPEQPRPDRWPKVTSLCSKLSPSVSNPAWEHGRDGTAARATVQQGQETTQGQGGLPRWWVTPQKGAWTVPVPVGSGTWALGWLRDQLRSSWLAPREWLLPGFLKRPLRCLGAGGRWAGQGGHAHAASFPQLEGRERPAVTLAGSMASPPPAHPRVKHHFPGRWLRSPEPPLHPPPCSVEHKFWTPQI